MQGASEKQTGLNRLLRDGRAITDLVLFGKIAEIDGVCMELDKELDATLVDKALEVERKVWEASGLNDAGSIEDYNKYLPQSRIFAVFGNDAECLAVSRVFEGRPLPPPFLSLPIDDPQLKTALELECQAGNVEELATAAVLPKLTSNVLSLHMWRLAYRDAVARDVKAWGIIMEPKRVAKMNRIFGFCFDKIGPETYYQGGYCATHLMDMHRVQEHMKEVNPKSYHWFTEEPLSY